MTIWSLFVFLTAATLGLAAFSPHAAQAEDFPSFSFMNSAWNSMRPEIESYVSGISSAKRKNVTTVAQASGKIAPETPEISATATSPPCLTKEYLATGAVLFKDACTEQWAINSTTVARHKPAGRACLSKEVSDDGIVIFRDTCTSEWAMNSSQNPAPSRYLRPWPRGAAAEAERQRRGICEASHIRLTEEQLNQVTGGIIPSIPIPPPSPRIYAIGQIEAHFPR